MKKSVFLGVLIGLLIVSLSKGKITGLRCSKACTCNDICPEALTTFNCTTCQSKICSTTGAGKLTFSFRCGSRSVSGTYDNPTQTLEYSSGNSNKISKISVLGLFSLMYLIKF